MSPAFYCRALSSDACRRHNDYAKDIGIQPPTGTTGSSGTWWDYPWCLAYSWDDQSCWSREWRCN